MREIHQKNLEYSPDTDFLFDQVAHLPWAQFLDSGGCGGARGRYDILVADPAKTLVFDGKKVLIHDRFGNQTGSDENPFQVLQKTLDDYQVKSCDLPFCGGALGYFSYDLLPLAKKNYKNQLFINDMPQMAVGIYEWALVVDHHRQRSELVGLLEREQLDKLFETYFSQHTEFSTKKNFAVSHLKVDSDFASYQKNFYKIQQYLHDGDCYQVNYARCFSAGFAGDSWMAYRAMREQNPVPFGAYLNYPFGQVLSASPERFLELRGNQVETRPIKGTRPRGVDPAQDEKLRLELAGSEKDRAENLMIVDLLRNDLGKSCEPGSIKAPHLFEVEVFPTVFHLVSSVTGQLVEGKTATDLLQGCFPGGSITGAPKKRAMEIIAELENYRRGVYCGAIGYIGFDGRMDMNIAIRTMIISQGRLSFWAGGGIVADSDAEQEFEETRHKAAAFFHLLGVEKSDFL